MQRIPFGSSPTKENSTLLQQSPNKKGKSLVLIQLVSFIKNSGITLPPSLAKMISNGLSCDEPLKQPMTSRQNVDDSKKLKIQLSDVQFQYKKLEQDFAQFKRSTRQEREKQIKRYENTINLLKNSLENTNQDYSYSISKQKKAHLQEVTQLKERSKLWLQQQVTKIKNDYQNKIEHQSNIHRRQLSQFQRNQEQRYNHKVNSLEQQIKKIKIEHSNQFKDINIRQKKIIQEKDKKHDSVRVALESQRKTQEKLHQKTKLQAKKCKQQLVTELCYEKNVNIQLKEEIQAKDKQILRLENMVRDKDIDMQLLEQKHKKQINDKQAVYKQNLEQLKKYQSQQILTLKNAQKQQIQKFQNRLQKLQIIRKEKEELMMTNIQDISNNFQRRPSKKQDITELQKMKFTVAKKEEQIRKLSKELKHCSLQLENKEQMYTRIFRANSKNKELKELKSKDQKQQNVVEEKLLKEPLFRKSHTSDIKLLLKMFKNTKDVQ